MRESEHPLVSFVTPFYNTEKYLAECIESVLAQSYPNWEYLLVNNCSTDGSLEIAQRYAAGDKRIRLTTNLEFLGQLKNYNHALKQISPYARFVKIVQADDWIFPECTQEMVNVALADPDIAIVSAYSIVDHWVNGSGLPYPSPVTPGEAALRVYLRDGRSVLQTPTSLLYRADLIRERDAFFPEESLLPDLEVCFPLLMGRKLGFVHQVLTYAREDDESISARILEFNPWPLHRLILMRKYGPQLLGSKEYADHLFWLEQSLMRFLGHSKLKGRSAEFWEYQRKGFAAMNKELNQGRLWWEAIWAAIELLANPVSTWRSLRNRFQHSGSRKHQ
jgi:glycosyltransferase involved in cell wall biosynthesis